MRYPGDSDAGRAQRQRQSPSGQVSPPGEPPAPAPRPARPGPDRERPAPGPSAPGGGRHRPTAGSAGKGPLRGFPPAPGQPPPLYPPGQFSAWNRSSRRDGNSRGAAPGGGGAWQAPGPPGQADRGRPEPDYPYGGRGSSEVRRPGHRRSEAGYPDPDYSALAVSEPAADFTSTQSWEVVDDNATGSWGELPADTPSGRLAPPADRGFGDGGRHGHRMPGDDLQDSGIWDSGLQDAATGSGALRDSGLHSRGPRDPARQDSGLQQRVTRPRVPPAAAAPATPRSGHRRAPEQAPPGDPEMGRAGGAAPGRMADPSATGGRPAPAAGSRHGARGRPRPKRRGGRTRLLLAGGAVAAVIAVAAAYLVFSGGSSHSNGTTAGPIDAKPKASVGNPGPPASLGQWGYIASRTTDPVPLSLGELFPSSFAAGGLTYTMTVDKSRIYCNLALVGSSIQSAAQSASCNQAMSASYLSSDQKLMGTIGVLNLAAAAGSESTGKAAGAAETIAQLPGPSGPTAKLTQGTGIEAAEVKGHYLVLVWAEFTNLQAPSTPAEKAEVQDFITLLIERTANISLATREVTGKPAS